MASHNYNSGQIVDAVKSNVVGSSAIFYEEDQSSGARKLHAHIDRLLLNIYVAHTENKFISKMQACRLVPADHIDTCKKYVEMAKETGLVSFEIDLNDKRRTNVVPTQALLQLVEERVSRSLDLAQKIAQRTRR